jgi:hypothetical protein
LEHAQNMAVYPDSYTILEEFMGGLPPAMILRCFHEHRLTTEANLLDDWVGAAKEIERCDKMESYYKDHSCHHNMATGGPAAPRPLIAKAPLRARLAIKDKDDDTSPQKTGVNPVGRFGCPNQGGRGGGAFKAMPLQEKRCYCEEVGHLSRDCPKPPKVMEFVQAARTMVGAEEADNEMDNEGSESMFHNQDDRASSLKNTKIRQNLLECSTTPLETQK